MRLLHQGLLVWWSPQETLRARIWLPLDGASSWRGNRPPTRRIKPGMGSTGRSRDGLWKLDSSGHGNTSSWRQRGPGAPPCLTLSLLIPGLQPPVPCKPPFSPVPFLSSISNPQPTFLLPILLLPTPSHRERPGLQFTNRAFYLILYLFQQTVSLNIKLESPAHTDSFPVRFQENVAVEWREGVDLERLSE